MSSAVISRRRRIVFTVALVVVFVAVFVVKLVDIQVVRADTISSEALENRSDVTTTVGVRGSIVDKNGTVMASSIARYDITVAPSAVAEFERTGADGKDVEITVEAAAAELAGLTGMTQQEILSILTANPKSDHAYVIRGVDTDTFRAIRDLDIPWVYFEAQQKRNYPNGAVGGNIVGFVGSEGDAQAGLEVAYEKCLAGTNGSELAEIGADGVRIPGRVTTTKEAVDGGTVMTTIDSDLQWFAQEALAQQVIATGAESGTAVVQEVSTGKLLAVADFPTVDPNNVDQTPEEFRGSQAFQAPFEPGSTFKTFTAAALLGAGLANPGTQVVAPGRYVTPGGAVVTDSSAHEPQNLTLTGVMEQSSNTGISILSEAMSLQDRWEYMKKFHLGEITEVGFPAEAEGTIRTPEKWDEQTAYNSTFGQGITVTAVQMASMYQAIGNGGTRLPVVLVDGCKAADGTITQAPTGKPEPIISAAAAMGTINMMEAVVTDGYAAEALATPGYRIAAKTGTAEMSDGNGQYGSLYLTSLTGLAPAEKPAYVVSVTISKPVTITSGMAAAPVFQKIMSQVLKSYRVLPSTEPAPILSREF